MDGSADPVIPDVRKGQGLPGTKNPKAWILQVVVFNPSKLAKENDVGNILVIAGGYSQEITNLIKSNFKKFNIYIFDKNNILSC